MTETLVQPKEEEATESRVESITMNLLAFAHNNCGKSHKSIAIMYKHN